MIEVYVIFVIIAYYVSFVCKTAGVAKRWLPVTAATAGIICALVAYFCGLISWSFLDSIAIGIFSGFSATGTNEIVKYTFSRKEK